MKFLIPGRLAYIYIALDPVNTGTYTLNILLYGRTLPGTRLLCPLLCPLSCLWGHLKGPVPPPFLGRVVPLQR